jgi:hypothetical protein
MALHVGTAWHAAMEHRWKGADYETALGAGLATSDALDAYTCATIGSLLAGYYWYYGETEQFGKLLPELEFNEPLAGMVDFNTAGKIDGLGQLTDGRTALIESKTTRDSLDDDSDYWLRLRFNSQVYQYIMAARSAGWDLSEAIYDVTKKPGIKPKMVNDLDKDGLKIVVDRKGKRVYKANGEPRLTGDTAQGFEVKQHRETPKEFGDRLLLDVQERPTFYFARREVTILEDELEAFVAQRLTLTKQIEFARTMEAGLSKPEDAWPRHVDRQTCGFCSYKSFCLQNLSVDLKSPPAGFIIERFNPELTDNSVIEAEETNETE